MLKRGRPSGDLVLEGLMMMTPWRSRHGSSCDVLMRSASGMKILPDAQVTSLSACRTPSLPPPSTMPPQPTAITKAKYPSARFMGFLSLQFAMVSVGAEHLAAAAVGVRAAPGG